MCCQILEKVGLVGLHWRDLLGDVRCMLLEAQDSVELELKAMLESGDLQELTAELNDKW